MLLRAHLGLMIALLGISAQAKYEEANNRYISNIPSRLVYFNFGNKQSQPSNSNAFNSKSRQNDNVEQVQSASGNYEVVGAAALADYGDSGAGGNAGAGYINGRDADGYASVGYTNKGMKNAIGSVPYSTSDEYASEASGAAGYGVVDGSAGGYNGGVAVALDGAAGYANSGYASGSGALVNGYAISGLAGIGASAGYGSGAYATNPCAGASSGCGAYQGGGLVAYPVSTPYQTGNYYPEKYVRPVLYQPVQYVKAPIAISPVLVPQPQSVPVALAPVPASSPSSKSISLGLDKLNLDKFSGLTDKLNLDMFSGLTDKLNLDKLSGLTDKLNLDKLSGITDKLAGLELMKSMPSIKLPSSSKSNGLQGLFDKLDGLGSLSLPSVSLHVPDGPAAKQLIEQLISASEKLLPAIRLSPKAPIIASSPMAAHGQMHAPVHAQAQKSSKFSKELPSLNLSKFKLPELSSLGSSLGGLSDLFSKLPKLEIVKREKVVPKAAPVRAPIPVPVPNKIITAYPLQKGAYSGHVVVEDYPYGRPQYGGYDEGGEASLGCAELDTAVPVSVPAPAISPYQGNTY